MKLLLQTDIPKLGYYGDVVEVSDGYARNYLLPQRMAIKPTEHNIKAIEQERARRSEERRLMRSQLEKTAAKVDQAAVTITALSNEQGHLFGSITEDAIAEALREQGHEIQVKQIVLSEHLRTIGEHPVKLQFADDLIASITVTIQRPEEPNRDGQPEQPQSGEGDGL
jgi:large subunit ribosomal protein L9